MQRGCEVIREISSSNIRRLRELSSYSSSSPPSLPLSLTHSRCCCDPAWLSDCYRTRQPSVRPASTSHAPHSPRPPPNPHSAALLSKPAGRPAHAQLKATPVHSVSTLVSSVQPSQSLQGLSGAAGNPWTTSSLRTAGWLSDSKTTLLRRGRSVLTLYATLAV